ncbi:DUF4142 domain-containing protein [Enterobacter sp. I4]|uniref:DUF4142 domain-containing protein n=1 Tax=Enterobacter sp. I4 TaxID=2926672 RepID=UPI001F55FBF3|nr:DUF4142 domain-containing protein [Enterobacter sp. I4]MCI2291929.1 DUF4142 domain-containing protein [Enterobacter sp. I4]
MHTSKTLKRVLAVSVAAAMFSTVGVQAQTTNAAQTSAAGQAQSGAKLSSGDAFDKMYMEYAGVKDHQMVLSKLQKDASKIDDPDVKALANEHTPVVEQHLKTAEQMSVPSGASADKK